MIETAARLILAAILALAAATKLRRPSHSRAALATYGFSPGAQQWAAWLFVVAAEIILAVGVGAGSQTAAWAAAGLMLLFAATLGSALMAGKAGEPCACFGGGAIVSPLAIVRNLALATALFMVA